MITLGIDIGGSSVKTAAMQDERVLSTAQSAPYSRPNTSQLIQAIRMSLPRDVKAERVGLCLPGIYDSAQRKITASVNVPGLMGLALDELISNALGTASPPLKIFTDALAAAHDILAMKNLSGRVLVISLGTGIGAAVLDEGRPLHVDGNSPGHLGQMDVTIEGHTAIGPDGGAGSLEGYMGAAALIKKYGDVAAALKSFKGFEPPLRALGRAIRIAHAIYRPQHVVLAGGIGIRMGHLAEPMHALVNTHLSSIARTGWTLSCGDSDFHAARGAAKLAGAEAD